jgi:hypothetical protein
MDRQPSGYADNARGPRNPRGKGGGEGKGAKGKGSKGSGGKGDDSWPGARSPQESNHESLDVGYSDVAAATPPPEDAALPARKRGRGTAAGAAGRKAEQEAKLKAAMEKLVRDGHAGGGGGSGFDFTSVSEVAPSPPI